MAIKFTRYFTDGMGKLEGEKEEKAMKLVDELYDMLSNKRDNGELFDGKLRTFKNEDGEVRYSHDGTDTELKRILIK